jgi:hypothetical protein
VDGGIEIEYRDIIRSSIEDLLKKKESTKSREELDRINRTISSLLSDLQEYERHKRWKRYGAGPLGLDEIMDIFFRDLLDRYGQGR